MDFSSSPSPSDWQARRASAKDYYERIPYGGSANQSAKDSVNGMLASMMTATARDSYSVLTLDAPDMGTCKHLSSLGISCDVTVPNACEFGRFPDTDSASDSELFYEMYHARVTVKDLLLGEVLTDGSKSYHCAFFDFCCTFGGNEFCRPQEDIASFFKNGLLANGGVFGVTFSSRVPGGSSVYRGVQTETRDFVLQCAKTSGYFAEAVNYKTYAGIYVWFFRFQINAPRQVRDEISPQAAKRGAFKANKGKRKRKGRSRESYLAAARKAQETRRRRRREKAQQKAEATVKSCDQKIHVTKSTIATLEAMDRTPVVQEMLKEQRAELMGLEEKHKDAKISCLCFRLCLLGYDALGATRESDDTPKKKKAKKAAPSVRRAAAAAAERIAEIAKDEEEGSDVYMSDDEE